MKESLCSVSTLTQYIELINNGEWGNCFFRGENKKYDSIASSLVRGYKPVHKVFGLNAIYNRLISEYYQEVGNDLNHLQSKFFLAFAQHHGLKTNLIDFTTAPLVALYFACRKSFVGGENTEEKSGYVYIIEKDSTIDATDFLHEFSLKQNYHVNIYEGLAQRNKPIMIGYQHILKQHFEQHTAQSFPMYSFNFADNTLQQAKSYDFMGWCSDYEKMKNSKTSKLDECCAIADAVKLWVPEVNECNNLTANELIMILTHYFYQSNNKQNHTALQDDIKFPSVPYLMYRTPLKFDRIRNQSGLFLYQGFLDYFTSMLDMGGIMIQEIVPDKIIEVNNQEAILRELDMLGINQRFLFGDFDSTASYINQKCCQY